MRKKPSYVDFQHDTYKWKSNIDYRMHPELYHIGRGQQGVLTCEPYKSELHPIWRFKTPREAQLSANKIYIKYLEYLDDGDFVGCDMAKKYLHMGFTRARRYANHRDGKKYNDDGTIIPQEPDALTCDKATSARIFYACWKEARENKKFNQDMNINKELFELALDYC